MQPKTILTAQAITASGNETGGHSTIGDSLSVQVNITAASGTTPSMTLSVTWSDDGVNYGQANPADVFTAITATGSVIERFTVKGAFYKLAWIVTGTNPSFTTTIETLN